MQKVVGSNPISRFFTIALHVGGLDSARVAESKWNHPRISPSFWELIRISAWNGPDARRFRLAFGSGGGNVQSSPDPWLRKTCIV
jgi:hypothetical protein